jgi:hypothetical protein
MGNPLQRIIRHTVAHSTLAGPRSHLVNALRDDERSMAAGNNGVEIP